MNVNLDEIKQYNARLKANKEQISRYQAEIEYTQKELENSLAELSQQIGMTVTVDNIEQVYANEVNKISTMLESGKAVLDKIDNVNSAENVQVDNNVQPVVNTQVQVDNNMPQVNNGVGQVVNQQVQTQSVQQVQPVQTQPVQPVQQAQPVQPQQVNNIFNGAPITNPMGETPAAGSSPLPQLFGI